MSSKAIFLDRDGVINRDALTYTWKISDFHFLPGIMEGCRELIRRGYQLIIITNQGGIAKGLYTHEDVKVLHDHMLHAFLTEKISIREIYYCPHHQDFGKCLCRKPESLLVEKSLARFDIDASRSFFIGDRERDILAGEGAGVKGILVPVNDDIRKILHLIP